MTQRRRGPCIACLLVFLATACTNQAPPPTEAEAAPPSTVRYEEITTAAGLHFVHRHGGSGLKYMPETMGSGAAFLDYDGDGDSDLYLVGSGPTPGYTGPRPESALYRNRGDGTFEDVTATAGVGDPGYGMGATAGDYDNDGDVDLYVTCFGPNVLYRNRGDGTFEDVSAAAGVDDPAWSASAAFGDYDADGDLDLYVTNYVNFTYDTHKECGDRQEGMRAYCHPDLYDGVPDSLYRNEGAGRFAAVGDMLLGKDDESWRLEGKGLGVVFGDYDNDGRVDIYVANDSTSNFLWRNEGAGFEDVALLAGVSFNEDGRSEAGMGTDFGDYDNDGWLDLFVTNLDLETNTLYRNLEGVAFSDETFNAGVAHPSLLRVGFGTRFLDYDNDGWLDLLVVNGHIIDNIELVRTDITHAQPALVFHNEAFPNESRRGFRDVTAALGSALSTPAVSRGLAAADIDGDGDLDLLVTRNNGPAALLRNDGGNRGHWLRIGLRGREANRDGYGTRVTVTTDTHRQLREHRSATSYLSQSEPWLHFGLGEAERVTHLEVRWPSGQTASWDDLAVDETLCIEEGVGLVPC